MRILTFFLKDDAKDSYEEQIIPVIGSFPLAASFSYVIHSHLQRFLADNILREAIEEIIPANKVQERTRLRSPRVFLKLHAFVATSFVLESLSMRT